MRLSTHLFDYEKHKSRLVGKIIDKSFHDHTQSQVR